MDPLRIAIRAAFGFAFALAIIRMSGKRTVARADAPSFVLAVIVGDMFDDLMWAEVPAAQFVVGVGTLIVLHALNTIAIMNAGLRSWSAGRRS